MVVTNPLLRYYTLVFTAVFTVATWAQPIDSLIIAPPDQQMNAFVYQDEDGAFWVSSINGWYRCVGDDYDYFPIRDPLAIKKPSQLIQSTMFPDTEGVWWFSTNNRLCAFDREQQSFSTYPIIVNGDTIVDGYHVFHLRNDNIWLKAGNSITCFNKATQRSSALPFPVQGVRFAVDTFPNGELRSIVSCPWLIEPGVEVLTRSDLESPWQLSKVSGSANKDLPVVTGAVFANSKMVYLSTENGIAQLLLPEMQVFFPEGTSAAFLPRSGCFSVVHHPKTNHLVFSSKREGIWIVPLAENGQIQSDFTQQLPRYRSVQNLNFDQYNNLWETHYGEGVKHYTQPQRTIETKSFRPNNSVLVDLYADDSGTSYALEKSGEIWTLTQGQSEWESILPPIPGQPATYLGFHKTDQHLWAYAQHGIRKIDLADVKENAYRYFPQNQIDRITLISNAQGQLALNNFAGLFPINWNLSDTVALGPAHNETNGRVVSFDWLKQINDTSFLGAHQELNFIGGNYKTNLQITDRILVDAFIQDIAVINDQFWVGTLEGLYTIEHNTSTPVELLLPNDSHQDINTLTHLKEYLYIGSNDGLVIYHIPTKEYRLYTTADGLPSNRFIPRRSAIDTDDRVWMLTDSAAVGIKTSNFPAATPKYAPILHQAWINDQPYRGEKVATATQHFALSHLQNSISFSILAPHQQQAERNLIKYRLLGYDSTFTLANPKENIRFGQLRPGKYELEMMVLSGQLAEGPKKVITIEIRPPLWQQPWFILCSLLLIFSLLFLINRRIIRKKLLKIKRQLEQDKAISVERDRIASEVHDDLGGQLSSILFISEELLLTEDDQQGSSPQLNRINELSRSSLQNIRDIIFALDTRKASVEDLARKLVSAGETFFTDTGLSFDAEVELSSPEIQLSSLQKRNINSICKEAFHNIFKHADASTVVFRIRQGDADMNITISDNGRGFKQSIDQKVHFGLENMQQKTTAIGGTFNLSSSAGEGTLLTFILPLNDK